MIFSWRPLFAKTPITVPSPRIPTLAIRPASLSVGKATKRRPFKKQFPKNSGDFPKKKTKKTSHLGVLCRRCLFSTFRNLECAMATRFWGGPLGWKIKPLLCWICAEELFWGTKAKPPNLLGTKCKQCKPQKPHVCTTIVFRIFCAFSAVFTISLFQTERKEFFVFFPRGATPVGRKCEEKRRAGATQATHVARRLHAGGATQAPRRPRKFHASARRPRKLHAGATQASTRCHAGHASCTQAARRLPRCDAGARKLQVPLSFPEMQPTNPKIHKIHTFRDLEGL